MLTIKSISGRNFLSIGAVEQTISLDNKDLTLILGENLDMGGNDAGARNGVGKTVLLQLISYSLFGTPINTIKRDNLINRTNEKNMSATIEFSVRGVDYKIIRGRKPNVLKFFINNTEQLAADDDSQGENRQTQEAIEKVLCMSSTMFQHIIGLNSYTTPFLSMKVGDQREVIEQLLGITILSEKAEILKELNKKTKEKIQLEEFKIKGDEEANKRIGEQIDSLKRRQNLWKQKHESDLDHLVNQYTKLVEVDIEEELQSHRDRSIFNEQVKKKQIFDSLVSKQLVWKQKNNSELVQLENELAAKNKIDIQLELENHKNLSQWNEKSKKIAQLQEYIAGCVRSQAKEQKAIDKLKSEVEELKNHKCYACGQDFHDDNHSEVLAAKTAALQEASLQWIATNTQLLEHTAALSELGDLEPKPTTHYTSEFDAVRHSSEVENIVANIESKRNEVDPYTEQLSEVEDVVLGDCPTTHYKTETEAIEHRSLVTNLELQISRKSEEADPYLDQIAEMERTGIIAIDYTEIDDLNRVLKHQDYLLDLLTNKKSFVRKKIIEQNLSYLNSRLCHYLDKIGLPHRVVFQNDLSVEISELGRETDFDALSRGERNRVILSLSWAFRDVWETLYSPVNLIFIDELMDNGMDSAGVENGLSILKDFARTRNKSVWLVSHREELISRVSSILTVVKENGFTSFRLGDGE